MKKICNTILTVALTLILSLSVLTLLAIFLNQVVFVKNFFNFGNIDCRLDSFFSGLLGSFIAAGLTFVAINSNTDAIKAENQIKFRNLFSEEKRWKIHTVLALISGLKEKCEKEGKIEGIEVEKLKALLGEEYIKTGGEEKKICFKEELENLLKAHERELWDYMGTLELAEEMIKKDVLDEKQFKVSYKYRLDYLTKSCTVMKELNDCQTQWEDLIKLLNRA